jgi:hypothetical protein
MWLARAVLLLVGGSLAAVGVNGLLAPLTLLAPLGVQLQGPSALGEMRATYGGMHMAMGGFLLSAAFTPTLRRAALVVATVFVGGLAFGRAVGALVDGMPSAFACTLGAVEALGAAAGFVALRR